MTNREHSFPRRHLSPGKRLAWVRQIVPPSGLIGLLTGYAPLAFIAAMLVTSHGVHLF